MPIVLAVLVAGAVFYAVTEASSRWAAPTTVVASILVAAAVADAAVGDHALTAFDWIKLFSATGGLLYVTGLRVGPVTTSRRHLAFVKVLSLVNVVEVVIDDLISGRIVNGAAGVLLVVSIVRLPSSSMRVDASPERNFVWPVSIPLMLAYTAWNLAFAYRFGARFLPEHGVILFVAIFADLRRRGTWVQARVATLTVHTGLVVGAPRVLDPLALGTSGPGLGDALAVVALVACVLVAGRSLVGAEPSAPPIRWWHAER